MPVSKKVSNLENRLGYAFRSQALLEEALTHPSYAHEREGTDADNQRLEYLGDAVLQLIISQELYQALPQAPEGTMTKIRASLVCEPSLTLIAQGLDLGAYLRLGHGEALSGGADNPSNLSDALEALLGALYLEAGLDKTRQLVRQLFAPYWDQALAGKLSADYKSRLYEWAQARDGREVEFVVLDMEGPEHDRDYTVGLMVKGQLVARGRGKTKKAAEQDASFHFFQMEGDKA
jgi:ribonuclease-3